MCIIKNNVAHASIKTMNKPKLTSDDKKQMKILDSRLGMSNYVEKLVEKQQQLINEYLKTNLKRLGHEFKTDEEYYKFLKERVHRIAYIDQKYDLFLDYESEENKGTYIGGYSETVKIETVGSKTIVSNNTKFN